MCAQHSSLVCERDAKATSVEAAPKWLYGPGFDFPCKMQATLWRATERSHLLEVPTDGWRPRCPQGGTQSGFALDALQQALVSASDAAPTLSPSRHYCTDTETSEPETAVTFSSGWIIAPLVIFTGNRPGIFAWKVSVVTTP